MLLLGRVMAPEAAVLSLHAHHHTEEVASRHEAGGTHAEVSSQHRHCHSEQLYDAAFQPAPPLGVPTPRRHAVYVTYRVRLHGCPARHLLPGTALRGPPVA